MVIRLFTPVPLLASFHQVPSIYSTVFISVTILCSLCSAAFKKQLEIHLKELNLEFLTCLKNTNAVHWFIKTLICTELLLHVFYWCHVVLTPTFLHDSAHFHNKKTWLHLPSVAVIIFPGSIFILLGLVTPDNQVIFYICWLCFKVWWVFLTSLISNKLHIELNVFLHFWKLYFSLSSEINTYCSPKV